jgi:hypothetical protein
MHTSIGCAQVDVHEIPIDTGGAPVDGFETYYMLITPGINCMGQIFKSTGEDDGKPDSFTEVYMLTNFDIASYEDLGDRMARNTGPENWRGVGYGSRIFPITSDLNLEGYFETLCIPMTNDEGFFTVKTDPKPFIHFKSTYCDYLETQIETCRDTSSYMTCPLNDLNRFSFKNAINDTDFPIRTLAKQYNYAGQDNSLAASKRDAIQEMYDASHCARVFRFRVKEGTKFKFDLIQILNFNLTLHLGCEVFKHLTPTELIWRRR